MMPYTHLFSSIFFGLLLFRLNILEFNYALILVIFSVFMDIDHVFRYVCFTKNLSFKKMIKDFFAGSKYFNRTFFHYKKGFVLMIIISLIIFYFNFQLALALFFGYLIHILLDFIQTSYDLKRESLKKKPIIHKKEIIVSLFFIIITIILLII